VQDQHPCVQIKTAEVFNIPLRTLYSKTVNNLMMAGRNISATHVAFASTRVMATCAIMGQAVGTAAALAAPLGSRSLAEHFVPAEIARLQQQLLRDDAFLPGLRNADPRDLARTARLTASSETPTGAAAQVTDGITRALTPAFGPWADAATHRWESTALPATLDLAWPGPQAIAEIHLTFDSGLERELTLSASDSTTSNMVRAPQPELVCDYEIQLDDQPVVLATGNLLRKRVHRLEAPVSACRLRLVVKSTHGAPHARVFEIRAYGP